MANIFALLVGINNYPVKPLQGCINDVNAVKDYLEKFVAKDSLKIRILTDDTAIKPTKKGIIEGFELFAPAGDNDVCLFYYSGHGSYSSALPEFNSDSGYTQSFVCQDSRLPGGVDLMDKEMSFLIWKTMLDKPNTIFVAITDCCHSGTITKAFIDDSRITERMVSGQDGHVPSKVEDYYGYNFEAGGVRGYQETFSNDKRDVSVNQGRHIHLAASQDSQTSKELKIDGQVRGAFTHSLLKTLFVAQNGINYKDLIDKTSALVKNLVPDQVPDINLNGGIGTSEKSKFFLSNIDRNANNDRYLVYYDPKYGWCINGGLMQGICKGDKVIVDNVSGSTVISSPAPHFSVVMDKVEFGVRSSQHYATVIRQGVPVIKLSFADSVSLTHQQQVKNDFAALSSPFIKLVTGEPGKYILRSNSLNELFITLPGSEDPVFKPVQADDKGSYYRLLQQMESVAKWLYLLEFENGTSVLTNEEYSIKLYKCSTPGNYSPGSFVPVDNIDPTNELVYEKVGENWCEPAFKLSLTNNTSVNLKVTNAYLGFDYGIGTDYFEAIDVAPGNTAFLKLIVKGGISTDVVKMKVDKNYQDLGYNNIVEYLKLFISTEKVSTDNLRQDGIELAVVARKSITEFGIKSPGGEDTERSSSVIAWKSETIGFKIIKPQSEGNLVPNNPTTVGGIIVEGHSTLTGKVAISSSSFTSKSADGIAPPHIAAKNSLLQPVDLSSGQRSATTMDVLELFDVRDRSVVSRVEPMLIRIPATRGVDNDNILPIGYDAQTGLYYPVGYTDSAGNIVIEMLPEEGESDHAVTKRSFIGSIKIYFQKVIGQKLGFAYNYPQLAIVDVGDNDVVKYESDAGKVSTAISSANSIIIFVHGIIGDTEGMVKCVKKPIAGSGMTIKDKTNLVLAFDYENLNTPIEETARLLKKKLLDYGLTEGHGKDVTIVAHSMGGLVSRWFIEKEGGNRIISKLIMLGTPNSGTPWSDVRDMAQTLLTYAINGAAFLKPWTYVLSGVGKLVQGVQHTLKQMNSETGIYSYLNSGTNPGIPYVVIAGNTQKIVTKYDETAKLISKLFDRLKDRGVYDVLDSVLFGKPNDIAVADDSITSFNILPEWQSNVTIHEVASDHLSYFENGKCVQLIFDGALMTGLADN